MADKYKPSTFDKAILKVAPGFGLQRIKNQYEAAMISGAYEATRPGNRPYANYTQFLTSPNSRTTALERQKLVNFNRFLCQSSVGTAVTNRLTDHAIGNGLHFRASVNAEFLGLDKKQALGRNQELTRLWKLFFQGENGHFDRMYSGGYLQSIVFKSMLEGGDNFVLPVNTKLRKNHRFPFALQTFESERVSTPRGKEQEQRFYQGMEKNDQGVPIRVHVAKDLKKIGIKDASYFNQGNWEARQIFGSNTGVRQIFQVKNLAQDRPGALRGIPFLTPAIGKIIDHNELTDSVLRAAKIQSLFAAVWSGGSGGNKFGGAPTNSKTAKTDNSLARVDLTAGQIIDAPEGYSLTGFQSTQPGKDLTPFQMSILQLIGSITGIPVSYILIWFTKSYSASKAETAVFWTTVLRNRYAFVFQFLFPFWEYLLSWAVASGLVSAPGFFDDPETKAAWLGDPIHQFTGPRMPQLDMEKEAKGMVALKNAKLKSTRGLIEQNFEDDPDAVFAEIAEEERLGIFVAEQTQQIIAENEKPDEDEEADEDEQT